MTTGCKCPDEARLSENQMETVDSDRFSTEIVHPQSYWQPLHRRHMGNLAHSKSHSAHRPLQQHGKN